MHFPHGPPIRSRSIAEIARGKLHHYGIENIPRNPYAFHGALRNFNRTSSIRRIIDSAEQLHLKSEAEIKDEIKTMEQRIEQAKKELDRKREQKEEDLERGGTEIGTD